MAFHRPRIWSQMVALVNQQGLPFRQMLPYVARLVAVMCVIWERNPYASARDVGLIPEWENP